MSKTIYFAYGSNLDSEQMSARCPSSKGLFRARLTDHRLAFTHYSHRWTGGAADIVSEDNRLVWGVVYQLASDEFEILDRFESGYRRIETQVSTDDYRTHKAITYTVEEKGSFAPSPTYLDKMLHWGALWALPNAYLDEMRRAARDAGDS